MKPTRSATPITLIATTGNWACNADVREHLGAADVVRLYGFEFETDDGVTRFAALEDYDGDDREEIREALTEAAVEAYYERTEPGDSLEVRRGDWLRDQQKDEVFS
jgi:hypothetical protein